MVGNVTHVCPGVFDCSHEKDLVSFDLGSVPSYISISSSTLSCLGSSLILYAYFTLKDIRTGAQKIITLLAVADFFTAFGYIVGSVNFITHFNHTSTSDCEIFKDLCEIQSFVTTWSTMCSYCWTCILALYFFLILVFNKSVLAAKLIPLYNIFAWIGPLLVVLPLLLTRSLGFAPYVASNWCYIKDQSDDHLLDDSKAIALLFIGGKLWEIMSYLIVIVLYVWIRVFLSKSRKTMTTADSNGQQLSRVEKRLLAIPILYILLRMWGTLQFFYSLAVDHTNQRGCIPSPVQKIYFGFGVLQAIGDGGQGWGNAILYIFLSPDIRRRLFGEPFDRCMVAAGNKFQELLETETMSKSIQSGRVRSERASLVASENTVTGGCPAMGYGVKSYQKNGSSTETSRTSKTATSHSAAGGIVRSYRDPPTAAPAVSKALAQSMNIP